MDAKSFGRIVLIIIAGAGSAWTQFSANVSGVVQDASFGVIPNAKVELKNLSTGVNQQVTTGATAPRP